MQYEEVVKMIKESEARVDEVLKAAKLERHEKQPMTKEMLAMILNYIDRRGEKANHGIV